jgi:phosphoribosylformylglycinamidine cyclo-ligase
LLAKYSVDDNAEHLVQTVGEELLVPTRIYSKPALELLRRKIPVHGLAHITGGAFAKIVRLNPNVRYELDNLPAATGIFKQIQVDGNVDPVEMYRTFNMGIGFCVVCPKAAAEKVISIFEQSGMHCRFVGRIEKGAGEVVAKINGRRERI